MDRTIIATVSQSSGGNGFDGKRRTETRQVQLYAHYFKHHGRHHLYEVGDFVRSGVAKGWHIDSIN